MTNCDHMGEAVSLARELATPHFWEWLFRLRQDLDREKVQLEADRDRRHNHLVECYTRARDESGKPLFRDDGKPLFHVRPGREADTVLCWKEVEDGPATPVILLEHFDEMIELHEGALEHHTRNVAEMESKYRRLEHIVVNYLPAHLGKVPRLDSQHTADTFADMFRELLGHLIEHAETAKGRNTGGRKPERFAKEIVPRIEELRKPDKYGQQMLWVMVKNHIKKEFGYEYKDLEGQYNKHKKKQEKKQKQGGKAKAKPARSTTR